MAAFSIKLADSGLTEKDAKRLGMTPMLAADAKKLGFLPFAAFKIPYFDLSGSPTKFYRLRYLEDTRTGLALKTNAKAQRYVQPPKSDNEVYLPPTANWQEISQDVSQSLIITEGELKSACATDHAWPTIGLGGVWMFRSAKRNLPVLPIFHDFVWRDREVAIIYDSDAATNHHVVAAELALGHELTLLGARVRIGRIPAPDIGKKAGLDDFIVDQGADALQDIFEDAIMLDESRELHQLNAEVIYVKDPGLVFAVDRMQRMSASGFKEHHYSNRFYTVRRVNKEGQVTMEKRSTATDWLKWESRSQVDTLAYEPGAPSVTEDGALNVWRGMGVKPEEGDVAPWHDLLSHLFGKGEAAQRKWFEQWCAFPLQNLGYKMATASVLWGKVHGSGKTLVGHTLMRIYGVNSEEIHDTELRDERNEWAENKQFILADDITGTSNRELANMLKTLITRKTVRLNPKYIPSYSVRDCINCYFTANDPDAFYLDDGDRRYFIHEVRAGKYPTERRRVFVDWRDSDDGAAALYAYLLGVDLTGFDPQAEAMVTDSKRDMIHVVKSDLGAWVGALSEGDELRVNGHVTKRELWTSSELLAMYDPGGDKKVTAQGVARELRRAGYRLLPQIKVKGQLMRFFALRNALDWEGRASKDLAAHYELNTGSTRHGKKF